jgi:tRNA pseudouridine38-40 synthase
MRNFKLLLEYDGTDFHGLQRQPSLRTVQGVLESALSRLLGAPTPLIAAGRTDAGVHALGQVVNFTTDNPLPAARLLPALNRTLPRDLVAKEVAQVPLDFHARRAAQKRRYRYIILNRPRPSALVARFALQVAEPLDLASMQQAADSLLGDHDFRAFQAAGSESRSTHRRLSLLRCRRLGDLLLITLEADSFLYQMARRIVASLLRVARGDWRPHHLARLLSGREQPPAPAPPQGLCLMSVSY